MVTSADTSFLFSLYGNDANTSRATAWLRSHSIPLTLSAFNEYELGNVLRFAEFQERIAPGDAALFWAEYEADCATGRIVVHPCNLAEVIAEATRISSGHTLAAGHRSFDILHVAAALNMKAKQFLTFDANQKKLARSEGLKTPL